MGTGTPRVVVVTRPTFYTLAIQRHGTEGQARFVLAGRGEDVDRLREQHAAATNILHAVQSAIPLSWRRTRVTRSELDRFLFEPEDIVVVVGQDGLVANVARYLSGQPVIGVDAAPGTNAGVLVPHDADAAAALIHAAGQDRLQSVQVRTLVSLTLDDGQRLLGLNEVFIGQRTHQSARYRIGLGGHEERQSSSGVLVSTGTGATGWAASIRRCRTCDVTLPEPEEHRLAFFVREAWPGPGLGVHLTDGELDSGQTLEVTSEMDDGGVAFSDGIEVDALVFDRGRTARIGVAPERLHLALA